MIRSAKPRPINNPFPWPAWFNSLWVGFGVVAVVPEFGFGEVPVEVVPLEVVFGGVVLGGDVPFGIVPVGVEPLTVVPLGVVLAGTVWVVWVAWVVPFVPVDPVAVVDPGDWPGSLIGPGLGLESTWGGVVATGGLFSALMVLIDLSPNKCANFKDGATSSSPRRW